MSVESRSASDSTSWIDPMRYAVVIEKGQRNFSAYVRTCRAAFRPETRWRK